MIDLKRIGLKIGHTTDEKNGTGCSVFIFDKKAKASVFVSGLAPASRETELLKPGKLLQFVNAIALTGGSAYGLEVASGVMSYLESKGIGYDTKAALVPIVPCAAIYDLKYKNSSVRPDKSWGYEAAKNADYTMRTGIIGAAAGASVGKILGMEHASKTSFGYAYLKFDLGFVAAFAVVNALGEIIDNNNEIVAGNKDKNGFLPSYDLIAKKDMKDFKPAENTTLVVVVTDYPLNKDMLQKMAQAGNNGIVRSIRPSNTPFDGDIVFAVSVANQQPKYNPYEILKLFVITEIVTKQAILKSAVVT